MLLVVIVVLLGAVLGVVSLYSEYSKGILESHHSGIESKHKGTTLSKEGFKSSNAYSISKLAEVGGGRRAKMRVLLLMAHPDDETMFFGPTLLSLASHTNSEIESLEVYIHCLSKGLNCGDVRRKELEKAIPIFGVPVERLLVDDLEDGDDWSGEEVAKRLEKSVEKWEIDIVLTFDSHGISGHKNHISCHLGTQRFITKRFSSPPSYTQPLVTNPQNPYSTPSLLSSAQSRRTNASSSSLPFRSHIKAYSLQTSSLLVKYSAWLFFPSSLRSLASHPHFRTPSSPLLFSNPSPASIHLGMLAHHSQYVWFRKIYIALSHYVFFNFLDPILPSSPDQ